jgi:CcmD family protein
MSNLGFVAVAYILTWVGLAAFSIYLVRRRRRALQRLDETGPPTAGGHR